MTRLPSMMLHLGKSRKEDSREISGLQEVGKVVELTFVLRFKHMYTNTITDTQALKLVYMHKQTLLHTHTHI